MRKIVSKEDGAKRKKRNQVILGVVLGVVMILGTLGIAFQNSLFGGGNNYGNLGLNQTNYNGLSFVNQNGLWYLGNFSFLYLPTQVNYSAFGIKSVTAYQNNALYVYSDDSGAQAELTTNLGLIAQRVQNACPSPTTNMTVTKCNTNFPVKTCSDNFIIIRADNSNGSIAQNNNCVFINGKQEDLTKIVDAFLFKTLGIKQ